MSNSSERPLRVLTLGASFGTVPGMRIAAAGHQVTFVCRKSEATLINEARLFLRLPARDCPGTVEIGASNCLMTPEACEPNAADPRAFDLVCLAMQEPQYSSPDVRGLIGRIAAAGTPCLSVMNMPLPPFLNRVAVLGGKSADAAFTEAGLWSDIDPAAFTMASADPQAMRVDSDDALVTTVTLPTNFKVAPFEHEVHQAILDRLARDIDASRLDIGGVSCQPRVRLRPHPSKLIPLAKWPMLITGNFRCLGNGAPGSIAQAVCNEVPETRDIYGWVSRVCLKLGVEESTLVSFDRYREAAEGLSLPSSLARALHSGAIAVERVDKLIQALANDHGMSHPVLDGIVADVSARLEKNHRDTARDS